jgi:hypothetical protein
MPIDQSISVKTSRLLLALLCRFACQGGEQYYQEFLRTTDTNTPNLQAISAPALVVTNNTRIKVAGKVSLDHARTHGEFGPVRLGMNMDEVVAAWGKPPEAWWNGVTGCARFDYNGIVLVFAGDRVQAMRFNPPVLRQVRFDPGPPARSNIKEWAAALKDSSTRRDRRNFYVVSKTSRIVLTACFKWEDSPVYQIRLENEALTTGATNEPSRLPKVQSHAITKQDAAHLARLALRDDGIRLEDYQAPHVYERSRGADQKYYWRIYFEYKYKDPMPDSGIFVEVEDQTGDARVRPE